MVAAHPTPRQYEHTAACVRTADCLPWRGSCCARPASQSSPQLPTQTPPSLISPEIVLHFNDMKSVAV